MKLKFYFLVAMLFYAHIALADEVLIAPSQRTDAIYRHFYTQNIYTLLKLDTRNGRIWQVQWGDKDHRFTSPLNLVALSDESKPGRFTLYPTKNIFTFLLLDQDTGETWHIQWGNSGEKFIVPIN